MATLQKIRDRGPLIAIVIGFALLAFILGDLFSGGSSMLRSQDNSVAVVDGEAISRKEFQQRFNTHKAFIQFANRVSSLDQEQERQIQDEVWRLILNEKILFENLEDMGLWVSDREITELIIGNNRQRDPIMQQIAIFTDPQTRQFAPQAVRQFFNTYINSSEEAKQFGLYLEELVRRNKAQSKYQTLVSKGLNVTTPEARQLFKDRVHTVDFDYVMKPYQSVADEDISVSESELKDYYEAHKEEYKQDAARDIAYVAFNIMPSADDRKAVRKDVREEKSDLAEIAIDDTEAIINYIRINSQEPYSNNFYAKGEYPVPEIDSLLFSSPIDTTIGPYEYNGYFKIARIIDRGMFPDTVQASHILIAPDGAEIADMGAAKAKIDSLADAVQKGGDFAALAEEYSYDSQSAVKGGDIGKFTEEQMVKNFSDSCFYGNTGELKKVETQYGWHLVKITYQSPKQEKVFPVILSKEIIAGDVTLKETYATAADFASAVNSLESFEKEAQKRSMTTRVATDLTPATRVIAGMESPRKIINWVFQDDTEAGSTSEVYQSGDQFIVAVVSEIREEGIATFEQIKDIMKSEVIREKKADKLSDELNKALQSKKDLQVVAQATGGQFNSARNIGFSSAALPNIGAEPRVIGNAVTMTEGQTSEAIKGETGVFILKITTVTAKADIADEEIEADRMNAQRNLSFRASRQILQALTDRVEIDDNRYKTL